MSATGPPDGTGTPAPGVIELRFRRRTLVVVLALGATLCVVSVVLQLVKGGGWQPASLQLDQMLDVDHDLSVMNWLSTAVLLLAGLVALGLGGTAARRDRPWWWLLGAGVVLVSLDEAVGASGPVRVAAEQLADGGVGPALLVVVGVLGLVALAAGLLVLHVLPPSVRWRVLLAVVLLAVAAVGVDEIGPDLTDRPEDRLRAWYVAKATVEEAMELVAAVVLLDAMGLAARVRQARRVAPPAAPTEAPPTSSAPATVAAG